MKDHVIFVTGGGKGMGQAVALMAAERGANVVVADIDEESAQSTVNQINEKGLEAIAVTCDVSSAEQVKAAIDRTVDVYGRLDAAFNNAGIMAPMTDTADLAEEEFDRILNIN